MKEIVYETGIDEISIYDEYGWLILVIPTGVLLDFIEEKELNYTGTFEDDVWEERDESGNFHYTEIQVELKENAFEYLTKNTKETVIAYLYDLYKPKWKN